MKEIKLNLAKLLCTSRILLVFDKAIPLIYLLEKNQQIKF